MSQETLDTIRGLAQAAANSFDGALDDEGERIDLGLKRDEGHPVLDSRTMDGFKVKFMGNQLCVIYQSDIKLKDVHNKKFENEIENTLGSIVSHLKKQYKKITGKSVTLTSDGDADIMVQSTSKVRVFVNAYKKYNIGGLDTLSDSEKPTREKLDAKFRSFLDAGGWGNKPESKDQRAPKS
tara:strand:+ start:1733 stop:2275 length:543 start_codon:yes stop_codon:yes gene_type:complete